MKNDIRRELARPWTWERLRDSARHNRSQPTDAEELLWSALRKRPGGFKFRRQHAIDRFIVDFYCVKAQLVIEVDGPIHERKQASDSLREEQLKTRGLRIIHFTNDHVLSDLPAVISQIQALCEASSSFSPLSSQGEGVGG